MDEMTLVREFRADAPAGAPAAVRAALLDAIEPPQRMRARWPAAVAAAAAVAAVAVVVQTGPAASPSAATVLGRAAAAAASDPVPRPRDDQWVLETVYGGATDRPHPMNPGQGWMRFDGTQYADAPSDHPERLQVQDLQVDPQIPSPAAWYDAVAQFPHEPEALLTALRDSGLVDAEGGSEAVRDYDAVVEALGQPVLPAQARADLFAALATIPGVGIDDDADPDLLGGRVLAITIEDAQDPAGFENRRELLLDPDTYAYRGERVTALEDHDFTNPKIADVTSGETWYEATVEDAVVVDEPGQHG